MLGPEGIPHYYTGYRAPEPATNSESTVDAPSVLKVLVIGSVAIGLFAALLHLIGKAT